MSAYFSFVNSVIIVAQDTDIYSHEESDTEERKFISINKQIKQNYFHNDRKQSTCHRVVMYIWHGLIHSLNTGQGTLLEKALAT
jgi:hypothetical protein